VRDLTTQKEGNVKIEAEIGVVQPQTKECQQSLGAGTNKKQVLPWSLRKDCNPAETLIQPNDNDFGFVTSRTINE
jgi:hypothetical protein